MKSHYDLDLPIGLESLIDLALDLRRAIRSPTDKIWELLDADAWEKTRNPYLVLQNVSRSRLEEVAKDERLKEEIQSWQEQRSKLLNEPGWFEEHHDIRSIAYFSMEFGLSKALPIYSGGLGILAGDHLKTASDLGVPITGIGLLYQQGYFRQVLAEDGSQVEAFPYNDPTTLPLEPVWDKDGGRLRVKIELPGRPLYLRVWKANVGRVNLFLLDSNDPLNYPWDRAITANLYAPGQELRMIQEIVLGIGGWQALEKMGIEPEVCHLNEGHAAMVVLARAHSFMQQSGCSLPEAFWATRAGNVFTVHTPGDGGFDRFDHDLVKKYAKFYVDQIGLTQDDLVSMAEGNLDDEADKFTITLFALSECCFVNGVSRLHGRVCRRIFQSRYPRWPVQEVPVGHVTNGVHIPTWDSPAAQRLWARDCPPESCQDCIDYTEESISRLSDSDIWSFRAEARQDLVEYVRRRHARQLIEHGASPETIKAARHVLNPNVLTIGFARRATAYKRTNFLLKDEQRMIRILTNQERPVQLVMAAKAHPGDTAGREMVKQMANFAARLEISDRVVFLEDYDIDVAQYLLPGVDLWINTPRRLNEACGTSGMKVLANGGLNLSTLDGWWDEAYDPQMGWSLGDDHEHNEPGWDEKEADLLYRLLEEQVIPMFYYRNERGIPTAWVAKIRASMADLTPRYSSIRMMQEYVEKVYQPAAEAYRRRVADGAKLARELAKWQECLDESWKSLRFGRLMVSKENESWRFQVEVYLGDLSPKDVRVELYANPIADPGKEEQNEPVKVIMDRGESLVGTVNGFLYCTSISALRPWEDYTPRIVPYHPEAFVPLEDAHILWLH
ncbi:Maltodextrin phosphorylase [uncultured archaeon]|nr:Maltodextrin phosphorylase [uncultured archaeon]